MALSRMAAWIVSASLILTPAAKAQTADQALAKYHETFSSARYVDCPQAQDGEEIVVCGRSDERSKERLPLPVDPDPGARIAGEPISAVTASKAGTERCTTTGPNQSCSSGLPVFAIAGFLFRLARKVADPDR